MVAGGEDRIGWSEVVGKEETGVTTVMLSLFSAEERFWILEELGVETDDTLFSPFCIFDLERNFLKLMGLAFMHNTTEINTLLWKSSTFKDYKNITYNY